MAMRLAGVALVLGGCAGLLGIEPAVLDDGTRVTGRAVREIVANDATAIPGVHVEQATLENVSVRVLRDGKWVDTRVDVGPDGFAFDVPAPGTPYRLVATLDGHPIELQHVAATATLVARSLGRRDPMPVTQPTPIVFAAPAPSAVRVIASTGQWTFTQVTDATLDWRTIAPIGTAQHGLLSAAAGDRLFDLGYQQGPMGSSSMLALDISTATTATVEMRDGEPVQLSSVPVAIGQDRCAAVVADPRPDEARIRGAYPDAAFSQDSVIVGAAADPRVAHLALPLSLVASTQPMLTTFDEKHVYGNPFTGHKAVAIAATRFDRPVDGGREPIAVTRVAAIADETCAAPARVDVPIALPTAIALAGTELATDGIAIATGGDPVLSWRVDGNGNPDLYTVQLVEVSSDGPQVLRTISTTKTEVPLDSRLLLAGHRYFVRIAGVVGVPGAAAGDLSSFALPRAEIDASSHVFRAGP